MRRVVVLPQPVDATTARVAKVRGVIVTLRRDADVIANGLVAIWHPDATAELIRQATDDAVLEVAGDTLADYEAKRLELEHQGDRR